MKKTTRLISIATAISTVSIIAMPKVGGSKINKLLLVNNKSNNTSQSTTNSVSNIYNNDINVENVWGQALFTIDFNDDNTLSIKKGWSEVDPYSNNTLNVTIENSSREVLKNVVFKAGSHPESEAYNQLNGFNFNLGDYITISSGTGSEYFVNNGSKEVGTVTYKITQFGLVRVTEKATAVSALYDGKGNIDFSCKINPNSQIKLEINNNIYTGQSNANGLVNMTIKGSYGDTINICPLNGLESNVKVEVNKSDFKLQSEVVQVNNVWNQNMFAIKFNMNNTFTVQWGGGETNPYYQGNNDLTIQLLSAQGEVLNEKIVNKGGVSPYTEIANFLNGKSFSCGDILHIQSNSGANVKVGNNSYKGNVYLKLNQGGLQYLQANNSSYQAEYNGNNTIVSGVTAPNSEMNITVNGENYQTIASESGNFSLTLPSTVKVGTTVYLRDSQGVTNSVQVVFNKNSFAILNSKLEVINGWGTDAFNITFNPILMEIQGNGVNQYLGNTSGKPFLGFTLYNQNGTVIKNINLKGTDNTTVLNSALSGLKFNFGDIVALNFDSTQGKINVCNGNQSIANNSGNLEYFKITQGGLVKETIPMEVSPLNVLTYNKSYQINVKGKTTANTEINITVNGENFTGISNKEGDFSIEVSSKTAFTPQTAIKVKGENQIPVVIYPVAASNLQSNSGIYFVGRSGYTGELSLNPLTRELNFTNNSGSHTLGASGNVLSIKLTSPTGTVLLNKAFSNSSTMEEVQNAINGQSFQYGDLLTINTSHGALSCNVITNGKIVAPYDSTIKLKITKNGLVDDVSGQSIYESSFTPEDYYSNANKGVVATGLTASGWDNGSEQLANNMVMNAAMESRVNAAIKGCTNDYEKAEAIFKIVSPVPYENVGGNTINTYNKGGVCFNKAQLYAVMCQYAGIVSRVVTGYVNTPGNYQNYGGFHSWNQVWIPSQNQWVTVDTTWHIFNCGNYVDSTRHSFVVQATLWNPKESYLSYFKNDPVMAWYHTGEIWNSVDYYNFNLGNEPQFRNLFSGITPSTISFKNQWGWNSGNITFNGENNSFVVNGTGYNANGPVSISLVNPTTGTVIFNNSITGNQNINDLANEFKNEHYNIGDILKISTDAKAAKGITVIGNGKTISNSENIQMFKITEDGLVPFAFNKTITATATSITGLNNEPFYNTTIKGQGIANEIININVNGENFETKANNSGEFSINIKSKTAMTANSLITISGWGTNSVTIKPTVSKEAELEDSEIVINNVWNYHLGTIGFNSNNMTITNQLGWYETNPYLSSKAEAFSIAINNSKGGTIAGLTAMGSDPIPAKLEKEFNGKSINYGDFITIDYKTSANLTAKNVWINGKFESSYKIKGKITFYVTPKGLSNEI